MHSDKLRFAQGENKGVKLDCRQLIRFHAVRPRDRQFGSAHVPYRLFEHEHVGYKFLRQLISVRREANVQKFEHQDLAPYLGFFGLGQSM